MGDDDKLVKPYEQFKKAMNNEHYKQLQEAVQTQGYSFFRHILDGLKEQIKAFTDEDVHDVMELLARAKQCFPEPVRISPAWQYIWDELDQTVKYKHLLMQQVRSEEREGVWQIVMDNPYTNQEVVCYPNLSFLEAAYLYGYFRPQLVYNEYIEVQKVNRVLTEFGER